MPRGYRQADVARVWREGPSSERVVREVGLHHESRNPSSFRSPIGGGKKKTLTPTLSRREREKEETLNPPSKDGPGFGALLSGLEPVPVSVACVL